MSDVKMMEFPTKPKQPLTQDPRTMILFSKPKSGKTSAVSMLPNNLIVDLEEGSDHVGGLVVKANNFAELSNILSEMKKQKITYPYITLDTTTALEEMSNTLAIRNYQNTPMGKSFGKIQKDGKLVDDPNADIKKLSQGGGYLYLREAFQQIVNSFRPHATKCLILLGHVNDKMIEKDGKEIASMELDLTGKLARIMCSKVDAIGLVYREKDKVYVNFDGGGDSVVEARAEHLAGQKILLTEKVDGKIVAHWDSIFKELNK